MWPISTKLAAALRDSHDISTRFTFYRPGGKVETLEVPVVSGSVTVDRTAENRRVASFEIVDPDERLIPKGKGDLLSPLGTRVLIERGVAGIKEFVPLGMFRIMSAEISDSAEGITTQVEAADYSSFLSRSAFIKNHYENGQNNAADRIEDMVAIHFPDGIPLKVKKTPTSDKIAKGMKEVGENVWSTITEYADSIGYEVFFDQKGVLVIRPQPEYPEQSLNKLTPVWEFVEGENCTMLELSNTLTADPGYNGAIVIGSNSDNQNAIPTAVVWDEDRNSPTFYLGSYGRVPIVETMDNVTTAAQAERAARALFNRVRGITSKISLSAIPNPALDVHDIIRIKRDRSRISGNAMIESIEIPLTADEPCSITCREKRIIR